MDSASLRQIINNQDGMATFEALPILVVFMMLISYGMGLYGSIHSATLSSIAARSYAFETFRHRADLTYFRSNNTSNGHYQNIGVRYHGVTPLGGNPDKFEAQEKNIYVGRRPAEDKRNINAGNVSFHNEDIYNDIRYRQRATLEVSPIWVKVGYGMCINANCGNN